MTDSVIITATAVEKIDIRVKTLSPWGGTKEPLYLGIITNFGGREFPLRYNKAGLTLADGTTYQFGINSTTLTEDQQIYGSQEDGPNNILTYPLNNVQRVYLRKEPLTESGDRDDSAGIYYIAAFLTMQDGHVIDWSNRNRPDSSGPSPFWLGNEFGQIVYLKPEVAMSPQ